MELHADDGVRLLLDQTGSGAHDTMRRIEDWAETTRLVWAKTEIIALRPREVLLGGANRNVIILGTILQSSRRATLEVRKRIGAISRLGAACGALRPGA